MSTVLPDIDAAISAAVAAIPGEPEVQWEGRAYTPVPGRPFLTVQVFHDRRPQGFGADAVQLWTGMLRLVPVHPAEQGRPRALARAAAVLDAFPRGRALASGSARVMIEAGTIGALLASADWFSFPVSISWFCEEVSA